MTLRMRCLKPVSKALSTIGTPSFDSIEQSEDRSLYRDPNSDWQKMMSPAHLGEKRGRLGSRDDSHALRTGALFPYRHRWKIAHAGGELMWPERFGEAETKSLEST